MSASTVVFLVGVIVILIAALWHCRKSSAPLREEAEKKLQAARKAKAEEEAAGREKDRRNNVRKELFEDLSAAIADPEFMFRRERVYGEIHSENFRYKWRALYEFILKVSHLQDQSERLRQLEKQVATLREINRVNHKLMTDIQKALRMGEPLDF